MESADDLLPEKPLNKTPVSINFIHLSVKTLDRNSMANWLLFLTLNKGFAGVFFLTVKPPCCHSLILKRWYRE